MDGFDEIMGINTKVIFWKMSCMDLEPTFGNTEEVILENLKRAYSTESQFFVIKMDISMD